MEPWKYFAFPASQKHEEKRRQKPTELRSPDAAPPRSINERCHEHQPRPGRWPLSTLKPLSNSSQDVASQNPPWAWSVVHTFPETFLFNNKPIQRRAVWLYSRRKAPKAILRAPCFCLGKGKKLSPFRHLRIVLPFPPYSSLPGSLEARWLSQRR